MDSNQISSKLIEAFSKYSINSIKVMTKNPSRVEEILICTYGSEEYSNMTKEDCQEWAEAWSLFEKHYNISR